ncbi:MAG: hypothetical protein RLZZ230_31 [Candidatus Parcubacteria bacterium]|jgi:hypothetical protein
MQLINNWHTALNMPKYDERWHRDDMADELAEYYEAEGLIDTWSELSDVVYTYTRAGWSGHTTITFPFSTLKFFIGIIYMIPKYTMRWLFFRTLGKKVGSALLITEVRNPRKIAKLMAIAEKYHVDPDIFKTQAEKLLRYWILIP